MKQEHSFLDAGPCSFHVALFIGFYCLGGVFLCQVDIADCVVHLVQVILVFVACRHALELAHHLFGVSFCHHLGERDACVELQFVGWVLADDVSERLVGILLSVLRGIELSEQIPFASLLLASHLVADYLAQIGDSLVEVARMYVVVGIRVVPFLDGTPVERVALHVPDHVFRVIHPSAFHVGLGEPCPCFAVDGRLCLEESAHVGKGGSCLVEVALVKLRASHEHPGFPDEGVVFLAVEPFYVFGGLLPVLVPFGASLDAVALYGLFAFLYGPVEVALAEFPAVFVAHIVERQQFRVVVLVAVFLLERAVYVGLRSVVVDVVFGVECVPEPCLARVLLRCASCEQGYAQQQGYCRRASLEQFAECIGDDGEEDDGCTRRHVEQIGQCQSEQTVYPSDDDAQANHFLEVIGEEVGCHLRHGEQADGEHDAYQPECRHDAHGDESHHEIFYEVHRQVLRPGEGGVECHAEYGPVEQGENGSDHHRQCCQQPQVGRLYGE